MTQCRSLTDETIALAARTLAAGRLVAFPTETVYGLGADACNAAAVAAIFAAKNRPQFNPLISHVASSEAAFALGRRTTMAAKLAAAFWPGPMTLVLARQPDCPIAMLTSAGLDKIAVRVPGHEAARQLLAAFGGPVAAPSANLSGRISPSRAEHVMRSLDGVVELVLDGGPCESGVESTVIDCTGREAVILRPGGVTRDAIAKVLARAGMMVQRTAPAPTSTPASPGQMASHYAPNAPVRLNAVQANAGEELIGFGAVAGQGRLGLSLSAKGDLVEAAANLFDMLHLADASECTAIAVAPIPVAGLGEAINDRLARAAAPR